MSPGSRKKYGGFEIFKMKAFQKEFSGHHLGKKRIVSIQKDRAFDGARFPHVPQSIRVPGGVKDSLGYRDPPSTLGYLPSYHSASAITPSQDRHGC